MLFGNDALFKKNSHQRASGGKHSLVLVPVSRLAGADGVKVGVNEAYVPLPKGI